MEVYCKLVDLHKSNIPQFPDPYTLQDYRYVKMSLMSTHNLAPYFTEYKYICPSCLLKHTFSSLNSNIFIKITYLEV